MLLTTEIMFINKNGDDLPGLKSPISRQRLALLRDVAKSDTQMSTLICAWECIAISREPCIFVLYKFPDMFRKGRDRETGES